MPDRAAARRRWKLSWGTFAMRKFIVALGKALAACFIIDLPDLGGAEKIRKLGAPVRTLVSFEGH
jgi:hypothetical protein